MTLMDDTHTVDDASRELDRVMASLYPIEASSPVVAVEGPADVAELARQLTKSSVEANTAIDFYATAAQRFDGPGTFEASRAAMQLQSIDSDLKKFAEKAREALDSKRLRARGHRWSIRGRTTRTDADKR
jgi:hypothetical protein